MADSGPTSGRTSDTQSAPGALSIAFFMEQHLGHQTYSANLQKALEGHRDVRPSWIPIDYEVTKLWWERLPSETVRSVLRGRREVLAGLRSAEAVVDAYVFNTQVPAALGGAAVRRRPYVLCTDVTPLLQDQLAEKYFHHPDGPVVAQIKNRWNHSVISHAAGLAPWSQWARRSLIEDYNADDSILEVIPPGVDTASWTAGDNAAHSVDQPMRILFVGGDWDRKGGPLLLKAFRALKPGTATLDIVTRTPLHVPPGVTVHADLSPNDPELRALFAASDVFVLASYAEMFGIAAVEAAAAGSALIVTNVGGLADLAVDGETGYVIEVGDVDALIDRLRLLQADPSLRNRLGRSARERAVRDFDAETNAQRLIALTRRTVN